MCPGARGPDTYPMLVDPTTARAGASANGGAPSDDRRVRVLLVETADELPPELRSFLLDIKPGYETDPTRAIYNHVWLMGDATAIGSQVQAEVDDLAELAQIGGESGVGLPGTESEPQATTPQGQKGGKK